MKNRDMNRLAILVMLSEAPGHGYALHDRLEEAGFDWGHATGGLYRALAVLAEDGFVESYWDTPLRGPARRTYEITSVGRDHVMNERKTLHDEILRSRRLLARIPRS